MGFRLDEISQLLDFRENPQGAKPAVRQMAGAKLEDTKAHLADLQHLHDELKLLIGLCSASEDDCPILNEIDSHSAGHR